MFMRKLREVFTIVVLEKEGGGKEIQFLPVVREGGHLVLSMRHVGGRQSNEHLIRRKVLIGEGKATPSSRKKGRHMIADKTG